MTDTKDERSALIEDVARAICRVDALGLNCYPVCNKAGQCLGELEGKTLEQAQAAINALPSLESVDDEVPKGFVRLDDFLAEIRQADVDALVKELNACKDALAQAEGIIAEMKNERYL